MIIVYYCNMIIADTSITLFGDVTIEVMKSGCRSALAVVLDHEEEEVGVG